MFDQERYHRNYLHPLLDRGYRIYSATNGRYSLFILSIFLFLSFGVLDKTRSLNTALGDDSLFCESGVGVIIGHCRWDNDRGPWSLRSCTDQIIVNKLNAAM